MIPRVISFSFLADISSKDLWQDRVNRFADIPSRVVPSVATFGQGHPRKFRQGANEKVLPTDLKELYTSISTLAQNLVLALFNNEFI